ncbi:unnamed protein product [Brassicogethes aeneus]|uniref:Serine/threonine-protein phosphatase 2A activator n=1 Tax=Brassicogethes aeneus TaxID=1431903 RepID=A0A9P0B8Q8_BRAAE|nr:unnamed protein product [Brassicogethes aeneus]
MSVINNEEHSFIAPTKQIKTFGDMSSWDKSEAYFEYLGFIHAINESVKGISNSDGSKDPSPAIEKCMEMLDTLDKMIDDIPPIDQPQRFGNQAFKTWYQKLKDDIFDILQKLLPPTHYRAVPEIMEYLNEAFGNSTRIDYGTGHEISFVMFLYCLFRINFLVSTDKAAVACLVFVRYLEIVRKLQMTYRMEPAGSHGVWSLDDYQFVPFIWGSSQLIDNPYIEPQHFYKETIVEKYQNEYMFLSCIKYINMVKKGPFAEHSNQLWSVSGVANWSKINAGLIKMYKAEVLAKFPVVQHIVFGSLFTLKPASLDASIRVPPLPVNTKRFPATYSQNKLENKSSEETNPENQDQ